MSIKVTEIDGRKHIEIIRKNVHGKTKAEKVTLKIAKRVYKARNKRRDSEVVYGLLAQSIPNWGAIKITAL